MLYPSIVLGAFVLYVLCNKRIREAWADMPRAHKVGSVVVVLVALSPLAWKQWRDYDYSRRYSAYRITYAQWYKKWDAGARDLPMPEPPER